MSGTIYAKTNKHSMPGNKANERYIRPYTKKLQNITDRN